MTFKAPRAKQIFYGLALLTFSAFNTQLSYAWDPFGLIPGANQVQEVAKTAGVDTSQIPSLPALPNPQAVINDTAAKVTQEITPQILPQVQAQVPNLPIAPPSLNEIALRAGDTARVNNVGGNITVSNTGEKLSPAAQSLLDWKPSTPTPTPAPIASTPSRIPGETLRDDFGADSRSPIEPAASTAANVVTPSSAVDAQKNSGLVASRANDFGTGSNPKPGDKDFIGPVDTRTASNDSLRDDFATNNARPAEAPGSQVAGEDAINQPSRSNEFGQGNDQSHEMAGQGPQGRGQSAGEEGMGQGPAGEEGAGQGPQEEEQGPQQAGGGCSGVWGDNTPTSQACKERAKAGGGGGLGGFAGGLGGLGGGLGQVLNQATGGRGLSGLGDIQKVLQTVQTIASVVDGLKQGPMGVLNSALGAANGILGSADLTGSQVDLAKIGGALGGGNLGGGLASLNAIKDVIPGGIAQGINPNIPSNILNDAGRQVQQAATQSFGKVTGIPAPVQYSGTVGTLGTASV